MSEVIVRLKDIRAAGMCTGRNGARAWFNRKGLSWSDFIANGISSEKLEATGDAMALRVVEVARGRQQ